MTDNSPSVDKITSTVFSTESTTEEENDEYEWYRGQVHIHTNVTDKTDAVQWYKQHGYNFAVITDLNYATPVEDLKKVYDAPERFIVVPGIETNTIYEGTIYDCMGYGGNPKQVQSDDSRSVTIPPEPAPKTQQRQAQLIHEAGTIPSIPHPNLTWAVSPEILLEIDPAVLRHFEMVTTEPGMNDRGGGGYPSTTEIWDTVLSTGRLLYGVAADDSHHIDRVGPVTTPIESEMRTDAPALPGRTSIYVRAKELTVEAITEGIRKGDFYSVKHALTLPIEFNTVEVDEEGIRLELPRGNKDIGWSSKEHNPTRYRTYFIGVEGEAVDKNHPQNTAEVLKEDESYSPSYSFTGSELYVRARVEGSDGATAWTQPVFINPE